MAAAAFAGLRALSCPGELEDIRVPHLAAIRLVFAHEERLERSHGLLVQLALLVGLHVRQVFTQTHREAGILVSRILDEQATAEPLDRLALNDLRSIGALELAPRSGAQPAPREPNKMVLLLPCLPVSPS